MNKDTYAYEVHELALAINEACMNMNLAVQQMHKGNDYDKDYYIDQCIYWSKRACDAVRCFGLKPMDVCPKQEAWARMAPAQPEAVT